MSIVERNFYVNKTAQAFLNDQTNHIQCFKGCVGSGKSSACMIKIWHTASQMMPPGHDGIRRSRIAIIRRTYSQLKTTTIKTWQEWFPAEIFGSIKGDSPMTQLVKQGDVHMEVIFLALDRPADLDRLKSLEISMAYLNEAQFIEVFNLVSTILERTNRYPGKIFGGGLGRPLLIMDCNPPSTSHWIYHLFEKQKPAFTALYNMPPAIIKDADGQWINNPEADFIDQVPNKNYWLDIAKTSTDDYIAVSLEGKYGVLEEGKPVHPEYNDNYHHSSETLKANELVEIGLGWDFGLTPACAITQLLPSGQFVCLAELWTDRMALRPFAENVVIPFLDRNYPFWRKSYVSIHDPADAKGNEDRTNQQILAELGLISAPATSNSYTFRRDSLKYFLTRFADGRPGFQLSPICLQIREGLMGKFQYEIIKSSTFLSEKQYQPKPKKNMHSHICEALEYIASNYARVSKEPARDISTMPFTFNASGSWMSL